jgi:glycosyltransferase involved in cell wall biosynthesis
MPLGVTLPILREWSRDPTRTRGEADAEKFRLRGSVELMEKGALQQTGPHASTATRVLLVTPQPFYEDRGSPIAVRHLLEALIELGCEVDIMAFPFGLTLDLPGVRYFRVANPLGIKGVPIGFTFRKLFLDLLLAAKIRNRVRRERYVAIHALEEAAFPAVWIGQRHGVFVVYDMQSSLPEQLSQSLVMLRTRVARRLLAGCEKWLLRRANLIGCSAGLGAHARSIAPDTPVVEWHFPSSFADTPVCDDSELRRNLDLPGDARIVLYSGSFATYQGLDLLLGAIDRVAEAEPRAHFVLVGAESERELEAMRTVLRPDWGARVRLLRRVPGHRIPGFIALADVVVSTRRGSRNLPLKIFDYLAAGATILATDDTAHRSVLDERVAVLTQPSPEAFAEALIAILSDRERAGRLASAAKAYAHERMGRASFEASVGEIIERARRFEAARVAAAGGAPPSG